MSGGLVIWLHGLGDSGEGWSFLEKELRLPSSVRYIFPTAPTQAVSCNGGAKMTSWMDLETIPVSLTIADDVNGLRSSTSIVHGIIDQAIADGTPASKIVVGGFSQGAAMAQLAGFTYKERLAGVVAFSGWPPLQAELRAALASGANKQTPALVCHGASDNVVLPECGERSKALLEEGGVRKVTYATYYAQHQAHPQQFLRLKEFLAEVGVGPAD